MSTQASIITALSISMRSSTTPAWSALSSSERGDRNSQRFCDRLLITELRNYIAHGHGLLDRMRPGHPLRHRHFYIAEHAMKLVIGVLPVLAHLAQP